jgi:hypothetical protein
MSGPDDRIREGQVLRDPDVSRALAGALEAMRGADTDHGKLLAIREGAEALDRLGDDGSEALDELSDSAIYVHKLNPTDVQTVLAQGVALALEARAGRMNGHGAGRLNQPNEAPPAVEPAPKQAKTDIDWWRSKLIDVQELCDRRFAPLKYVVPGLFPEGVTLLVSRPKLGKSWLLLQITTAVAGGTITLTASAQPPVGDVLYLALEDNPRRLQRRLTKYFGAFSETWPARLKVVTEWKRLDQGGIEGLREWCRSVEAPTLIAIDTLKRIRPPKRNGQSDYDADYGASEGLQKLAGELGLSIIIAHHDRKMDADDVFDTVSGTLGLTGGVDTIAILKRSAQGATLHIQGRDMEDAVEKAIRFDRETCRWVILGEAAEVHRSDARKAVLTALTAAPVGLTVKEIMAAAGLDKRSAVDQLLYRMGNDGEIVRSARGRYALPRYALDALETSKKDNL